MARQIAPVRPVIVKKIYEAPHAGHHGGAWKVAYADFVTAMMALFPFDVVAWCNNGKATQGTRRLFRAYVDRQQTG